MVARWRAAAIAALIVLALAPLSLVLVPPSYRALASFVANPSTSAKLSGGGLTGSALGGLAAQLGFSGTSDPSESPAFYERLLHSRALLSRLLLTRFADPREDAPADSATLVEILEVRGSDPERRLENGVKLLDKRLVTELEQTTDMVFIRFDAHWPELSAAVVNRAVALVSEFNREKRTERIGSRREFLENRTTQARVTLTDAEAALRSFYEQNRTWRNSPSLVYAEQQLQRRVDMAQELYLALEREYNSALLDEFNTAALITVVDHAVPARKAQWPRYGLLLMTTMFVAFVAALVTAGTASIVDDWRRRNPDGALTFRDALRRAGQEIGSLVPLRQSSRRGKRVA